MSKVPLKNYSIPGHIRSNRDTENGHIDKDLLELLKSEMTTQNHEKKFQTMLHLEELQMEIDIRRYDMSDQKMSSKNSLMELVVSAKCSDVL